MAPASSRRFQSWQHRRGIHRPPNSFTPRRRTSSPAIPSVWLKPRTVPFGRQTRPPRRPLSRETGAAAAGGEPRGRGAGAAGQSSNPSRPGESRPKPGGFLQDDWWSHNKDWRPSRRLRDHPSLSRRGAVGALPARREISGTTGVSLFPRRSHVRAHPIPVMGGAGPSSSSRCATPCF